MCLRDLKTGPLVPPKNRLIITIKTTALIIIIIIIIIIIKIIIIIIIIIIIKWHALHWNIFEGKGVYFISIFNWKQTVVPKSFSEIHLSPAHVNLHV